MEGIEKLPYEISVWDDINKYHIKRNGAWEDVSELPKDQEYQIGYQYFDEEKQTIIGANDLNTPFSAHNPALRRGINGSSTLTFDLFSNIYDPQSGEYLTNPFVAMLVNERKIKLKYEEEPGKDPWHDFIIKDIQESSDNKTFSYTAISLEVNELSKTGFNIELNSELENNQGSIKELSEKVVAETDWVVGESPTIRQWIEEPIYEVTLITTLKAVSILDNKQINLPINTKIYLFYNDVVNKNTERVQFILENELTKVDNNRVIKQPLIYKILTPFTWGEQDEPSFASVRPIVYQGARAERLEFKQKSQFDSLLDRIVYEYSYAPSGSVARILYGYKKTEYISPTLIKNILVNTQDFTHTDGWGYQSNKSGGSAGKANMEINYSKSPSDDGWLTAKPYLTFSFDKDVAFSNMGVFSNKSYLKTLAKGEEFKLRIITRDNTLATLTPYYRFSVSAFHNQAGKEKTLLTFDNVVKESSRVYIGTAKVKTSLSARDFELGIPMFLIKPGLDSNFKQTLTIEKIELFRVVKNKEGEIIEPGQITTEDDKPIIVDKYYYYDKNNPINVTAKEPDEIIYEYIGKDPLQDAVPVYNDDNSKGKGFEKIRSVTVKETNIFNIIQSLCEIFESWAKFTINHEADGKIKQIEIFDLNGDPTVPVGKRQDKTISFAENIGKENYAGFRYGINLRSIQRQLDANQLATKVIVKDNKNDFANGGFCSITRSDENPSKENFILNLDYYVQQGLLSAQTLANDLYDTTLQNQKVLGYYPQLFELNKHAQIVIEENASIAAGRSEIEAQQKTYALNLTEAKSLSTRLQGELASNFGKTYDYLTSPSHKNDKLLQNEKVVDYLNQIKECKKLIKIYEDKDKDFESSLKAISASKAKNDKILQDIREQKEKLNKDFFSKYSRFIQEGSWISEDYVDDNLYYLDAYNVAALSAFPKVTYTINVMGLDGSEEYRGYKFDIGDITYVEDTEFFGWYYPQGSHLRTPYHERVVVSERIDYLDAPESNQIHVQNYNTQFEDLFQRIEATTQTVQYGRGAYNKVANIINNDGTISKDSLQHSLDNNAFIIQNAKDQSVVWGDKGITITNLTKPNEIIRLVSSGILLSNDGGKTYSAGITANGINANFITTGQINTNVINIMNGSFPSFRWDKNGLAAYAVVEEEGLEPSFNFNNFVRFDQYGLYGLTGANSTGLDFKSKTWEGRLDEVREIADFSLTWKGFRIKSGDVDSFIDITSSDGIRVVDNKIQRIKIGNIGGNTGKKYGLAIYNNNNEAVMETNDKGELWLQKALQIGTISEAYHVKIGNLGIDSNDKSINQVFNANDNFIVYEDGSMKATKGDFTGNIYATGGKIGNLTIDQWATVGYEVRIISDKGTILKDDVTTLTLTANLYRGAEVVKEEEISSYQWYKGNVIIPKGTTKTLTISSADLVSEVEQFSCEIVLTERK